MARSKDRGDRGEAYAAQYLERRKWMILERQWRCRFGELDLVARTPEGILCFVEVKLRGPNCLGLPREAVDARKRERIRKAASCYLLTWANPEEPPVRFDVAEVYLGEDGLLVRLEYIEDAFE